jgi:formamidopyrimidine-DNA glycosylase
MTGQLLWVQGSAPLPAHTRVRLRLEQGWELRFVDPRTFGQMWLVPAGVEPEAVITALQRLGPEPFSPAFSETYFQAALRKSRRPIKAALLDQSLLAGVGNIYADEALFLSGIHPLTPALQLSDAAKSRLREALIRVLQAGAGAAGHYPARLPGSAGAQRQLPGSGVGIWSRRGSLSPVWHPDSADQAGKPLSLLLPPLPAALRADLW